MGVRSSFERRYERINAFRERYGASLDTAQLAAFAICPWDDERDPRPGVRSRVRRLSVSARWRLTRVRDADELGVKAAWYVRRYATVASAYRDTYYVHLWTRLLLRANFAEEEALGGQAALKQLKLSPPH
jgi:hypothetical protein